jgi:hypothetical protein
MLQRTRGAIGFIEPCLPSPAKSPPSGPDWLHEIKHDGFRLMARRDAKGVRLYTRNGKLPFGRSSSRDAPGTDGGEKPDRPRGIKAGRAHQDTQRRLTARSGRLGVSARSAASRRGGLGDYDGPHTASTRNRACRSARPAAPAVRR